MSDHQPSAATGQDSVFENDYFRETQADILEHESGKTRQTLLIIAAILFASDLLALSMAHLLTPVTLATALVVPVIFAGLAILSKSRPKPAMLLASVLLGIIILMTLFLTGIGSIVSGFLVKGVIVYLVIKGWNHAKDAEEARSNLALIR